MNERSNQKQQTASKKTVDTKMSSFLTPLSNDRQSYD